MTNKDFVIIGGGSAGFAAIKAIREEDAKSSVLWISNEDRFPYKRTSINKHISSGFQKEQFALTDHDWLVNNHIELLYDHISFIEIEKKELTFKHHGPLRYNKLIICTGSTPNNLSYNNISEELIYKVHNARQVENILLNLNKIKKFIIVGGGVEGIETAEQLYLLNKQVTILERGEGVIRRFLTPKYANFLYENLKSKGIPVVLNAKDVNFTEVDGKKYAQIENNIYEYDAIIACIGSKPNIEIARQSHIKYNNGILVNEFLETSVKDIFAAGDVAEHKDGVTTHLWHAAERQGYIAGKNACNQKIKFTNEPFRMKTKVFNEFYFSVPPAKSIHYDIITESSENIERDLYFNKGKIEAILMKNDETRAKLYQQALLEKWTLEDIRNNIPF